ncbi:hypothetical protein ADUPG1_005832, partial [Aduncisulcus paluster]
MICGLSCSHSIQMCDGIFTNETINAKKYGYVEKRSFKMMRDEMERLVELEKRGVISEAERKDRLREYSRKFSHSGIDE